MLHSVLTDQLPERVSIILKEQIRGMDQLFSSEWEAESKNYLQTFVFQY